MRGVRPLRGSGELGFLAWCGGAAYDFLLRVCMPPSVGITVTRLGFDARGPAYLTGNIRAGLYNNVEDSAICKKKHRAPVVNVFPSTGNVQALPHVLFTANSVQNGDSHLESCPSMTTTRSWAPVTGLNCFQNCLKPPMHIIITQNSSWSLLPR